MQARPSIEHRDSSFCSREIDRVKNAGIVLSLFPGIDLFGPGFEAEGFCVVRGPDLIFGGDIRDFHPPAGHFEGVIGGPPCQAFSRANRNRDSSIGEAMLWEFLRVVAEAQPIWWLMENVPCVPDVMVRGYLTQRLDLNANECGSSQDRLRHYQFGSRDGTIISPARSRPPAESQKIVMASEARRGGRRSFADCCELQGLPRDFDLPGFTVEGKFRAVGNGVTVQAARVLARAVKQRLAVEWSGALCACGCGRLLAGREKSASAACRKRVERRRKLAMSGQRGGNKNDSTGILARKISALPGQTREIAGSIGENRK